MSNSTRRLLPALLVACMQTAAAFHPNSCYGTQFQAPSGEDEASHASDRTSRTRGSADCCAIDSGLLFTLFLSGSTGIGGGECQVAVSTSLVARECRPIADRRFCSVVLSAQTMPEAKSVEHRPVLEWCCDRPSRHPFSTADSQPDCRMSHATAERQVCALRGWDSRCLLNRTVSLAVERDATRSATTHITDRKQPRSVKNDFNSAGNEARLVLLLSPT